MCVSLTHAPARAVVRRLVLRPRVVVDGTGRRFALRVVFLSLCSVFATLGAAGAASTDQRIYEWRKFWKWCGPKHEREPLQGLDDANCAKRFPRLFDRKSWACPARWQNGDPLFGPAAANLSQAVPNMDLSALSSIVDSDIHAAVVVIKRNRQGSVQVRYLGNENSIVPFQPWSSSKILAAAAASMTLRSKGQGVVGLASSCENSSSFSSESKSRSSSQPSNVSTRVGDLLTTCCSYDTTLGISSNQIGAWFHSIGGHSHADKVLHQWLGAPSEETFGGDYGESIGATRLMNERVLVNTPSSSNPAAEIDLSLEYPPPTPAIANHMSALTMAEWMRRIVHAREDDGHINNMFWEDAETILYGGSAVAPSAYVDENGKPVHLQWGGASMSSDIYLQLAAGINGSSEVEKNAKGQWRIFSKLGFGYSDERSQFELVLNGYTCLPILSEGEGVSRGGLEFAISMWASDNEHKDAGRALDLRFQQATKNVTQFLLENYYTEN